MKKIVLFAFNEKSFLNNELARVINTAILIIILIGSATNTARFPLPCWACVLIPIMSSIICSFFLYQTLSHTTFFEWDYTERLKKLRFIIAYTLIAIFLSSLFSFSVMVLYISPLPTMGAILLLAFPVIFFGFNLFNITTLYYPIFKDYLAIGYKIQKKPAGWQEDGPEITEEGMVREIMQRDWGIGS